MSIASAKKWAERWRPFGPGWCQAGGVRLLNAPTIWLQNACVKRRRGLTGVVEPSVGKAGRETPVVEGIGRSQSFAAFHQLHEFVRRVFDLTKYFLRIFFGLSYDDGNRVVLRPELVLSRREVTTDLVFIKAPRKLGLEDLAQQTGSRENSFHRSD